MNVRRMAHSLALALICLLASACATTVAVPETNRADASREQLTLPWRNHAAWASTYAPSPSAPVVIT
ncbi:MAG TPA: hypothetical protein VLV48_01350, partial [Thermoanaerobaculia bacterium]|nr:hypothetical protein [Thermoanaerobaculia bacterium]